MNYYHKLIIFFISLLFLPSIAFAGQANFYEEEPVIKQCIEDGICTCEDMGGDIYDDGSKISCVFSEYSVEFVYSYFIKYHTPKLSEILLKEIPIKNTNLTIDDKDKNLDVDVKYLVYKNINKFIINIDLIYMGYSYIFTQEGDGTILEFVYFNYN